MWLGVDLYSVNPHIVLKYRDIVDCKLPASFLIFAFVVVHHLVHPVKRHRRDDVFDI